LLLQLNGDKFFKVVITEVSVLLSALRSSVVILRQVQDDNQGGMGITEVNVRYSKLMGQILTKLIL